MTNNEKIGKFQTQNSEYDKKQITELKLSNFYREPLEVNSAEEVPLEFFNHVFYSSVRHSDGKILFCSDQTKGDGRFDLDVEDEVFFYFVCDRTIAEEIIKQHKALGGPGSGWE